MITFSVPPRWFGRATVLVTQQRRGHSPTDKSQDKVLPIEVCCQPPGFGMKDLAMLFGESFHAESFAQDHESSPGLRLERAWVNYEFPSPLFLQPQPAYRCSIKIGGCPPCIFVSGINSNLQDYCYLTIISGTRRLTMTWPVELASKQQLLTQPLILYDTLHDTQRRGSNKDLHLMVRKPFLHSLCNLRRSNCITLPTEALKDSVLRPIAKAARGSTIGYQS